MGKIPYTEFALDLPRCPGILVGTGGVLFHSMQCKFLFIAASKRV